MGELGIAAALVIEPTARWGALAAAISLSAFAAVAWIAVALGRTPECNCFGALGSSRLGWSTGARNLLFAVIAALIAWNPSVEPSPMVWVGAVAGVAFATLGWFCFQLLRQNGRVLARLEALENALPTQSPGLAVGGAAPSFNLDDGSGNGISLEVLRGRGKPVLLAFLDADCAPCEELLPQLHRWQRERSDLAVAVISSGSRVDDPHTFDANGFSGVLVENDRRVATAYAVPGTPAAVLVGREGRIESQMALGADAIAALIDDVPGRRSPEESALRPAVGPAALAAGVGAVLVGATPASAQDPDPGIEEIRAKLTAAAPDFAADLEKVLDGIQKFFASKRKNATPKSARAAIAGQREDTVNLQADLATVTAESAQAQAVRDAMITSLGFQVEALDEFDNMLGLRSKPKIKRSRKKAFKLLTQARTAGYYASVGLGCTGKDC